MKTTKCSFKPASSKNSVFYSLQAVDDMIWFFKLDGTYTSRDTHHSTSECLKQVLWMLLVYCLSTSGLPWLDNVLDVTLFGSSNWLLFTVSYTCLPAATRLVLANVHFSLVVNVCTLSQLLI